MEMRLHYDIPEISLGTAGEASCGVKKILKQLGIDPSVIKKIAVAMYEAEINAAIHADGGVADVLIGRDEIVITIADHGPGIVDIDLAMQEGYSTAPDEIREMGFGAGMGLPNIKKNTDALDIRSDVGKGTTLVMKVLLKG
jgi:serine/threonine-protein kinase RsbT